MSRTKQVLLSSFKMALATLTSRVLGLVREQVMAIYFGASGLTDAFLVAYRIPNLLRDLFAEGAFSSAFVPTFAKAKHESMEKARELLWALLIALLIITGLISLATIIWAPEIVRVFAPTFADDPNKFEVTVTLTRLMGPYLVCVSIAALFMGALNSLKIFFIPSMAPAGFNIVMIACTVGLPPILAMRGIPIVYALGVGVLFGGIVQALMQIPLILRVGMGFVRPKDILSPDSKAVFKKLGPGLIGFSATQINLLINTILATSTVVGAVSWLNYAFRLFQFPVGILGVSIGNSNLVHFSDAIKSGHEEEAKGLLQESYFLSLFVMFPAMALMMGLATPTVNLIFEHGRFDAHSTTMTALALNCYLLGLPFYGLYKIFTPTFYALEKPQIPVITSVISIAANLLFSILLVPHYGFSILALGTGLSMFCNAMLEAYFLRRSLRLPLSFFINTRLFKLALSSAVVGGVLYVWSGHGHPSMGSTTHKILWLFTAAAMGGILHLSLIFTLGEREFVRHVWARMPWNRKRK